MMSRRVVTPAILLGSLLAAALGLCGCEKERHRTARREFQEILAQEEGPDARAEALGRFVHRFPEPKTNPNLVRACTLLAEHHARAGRSDIAASWYERAVRVAPDDPDLLNALGYHYASHGLNLDRAVAVLEKAVLLAEAGGYPERRIGFIKDSLGWAYRQRGDLPLAVAILEESVRLAPDAPILREHLAEAYRALGERERAADIYLDLYLQGRAVDPRLRDQIDSLGAGGSQRFRRRLLERIAEGRRAIDQADSRKAADEGATLIRLRSSDGRLLQGSLFLPDDNPRRRGSRSKAAGVLLIHALGSNRSAATPLARNLARHGMVALAIDLRGHGGSVSEEITAAHHFSEHLADNLRGAGIDAIAALNELARHPRVDAGRLAVLGAGMGALVAMSAAADTSGPRARCAILLSPWGHPDAYVEPFAAVGAPGVMLAYGDADGTAPALLERLARDNASERPAQIIRVAGDATGFDLARPRRDLGERIASFLEERLR